MKSLERPNIAAPIAHPAASLLLDLGLGVLWAWMGVVWLGITRIPGGAGTAWPVWLCFSTGIAFSLLMGPIWVRCASVLQVAARMRLLSASAVCALSTLAVGLLPLPGTVSLALPCILAAASGVAGSYLMLEWAGSLSRHDGDYLELVIPLCSLVSLFVACFGLLPDILYWTACALLPAVSAAMLLRRAREGETSGSAASIFTGECEGKRSSSRADMLKIALVTFSAYTLIKFAGGSPFDPAYTGSGIWNGVPHLFGLLMAVGIAFLSLAHFSRLTMAAVMRIVTPALVISCLLLLLPERSLQRVCGILMAVAETPLIVFATLWSMSGAARGLADARASFGTLMGSAQLGIFLGSLLLSPGDGTGADFTWTIALLCAAFILCASFAPARSAQRPEDHPMPQDTSSTPGGAVPASAPVTSPLDAACVAVGQRYGLSEREREVLLLLARGHSRAYIRDALFISKNTIATHARHIYQKTGAHSQQELIVLVEKFCREQNTSSDV